MQRRDESTGLVTSIHLEEFPAPLPLPEEPDLLSRWAQLGRVREAVLQQLEAARSQKLLGNSLEAAVVLEAKGDLAKLLQEYQRELPSLFIVSQVELGLASPQAIASPELPELRVGIRKADGEKCERCWNYRLDRGSHTEYPTLCARCASIVAQIHSVRP